MDENVEEIVKEPELNSHEAYEKKRAEMKEKYHYAVFAIAEANDMPIDDAFNMLESNIIYGGEYPYVKVEEFKADYAELKGYADENAKEAGLN